jgi:photosystem II stability/assembly factor-like uncharacterized protein
MRSLFLIGSMALCLATTAQNRPSSGADRQKAFQQQKALAAKSPYKSLQWRNVGPDNISGRVSEVLGVPGNKNIIWASFATGGFWKTEDAGKSWKPLFDNEGTLSVGSFDVAKSNPNIIYLGSGEANIFRASLPGMGVYKSEDGGKSWKHIGLENTSTISRVIIHPSNPNHVYVAASGNEWSNNKERGLFETTDGGKTWKKVYQSNRPFETTWKIAFPTPKVGYVTIQSYNPDPTVKQQRVAKTNDGGVTWTEINLVEESQAREFGIGFIDENHGFVGTLNSGFETTDGGVTWQKIDLGRACNKIRIYKDEQGTVYGYAIGVNVFKL